MSTAVLYCGQARTFAKCFRNQYWFLLRHLKDPTFYICVEDDEDAYTMLGLRERFAEDRVFLKRVKTPIQLPQPDEALYDGTPYARSGPTERMMAAHWNHKEAWGHFVANKVGVPSVFLKLRCDLYFHETVVLPQHVGVGDAYFPWWSRCGGINDRIGVMGPLAAQAYFNCIDRFDDALARGAPLHGETLLAAAMEVTGVRIHHELDCWMSFLKRAGAGLQTLTRPDPTSRELMAWTRSQFQ